MLFLYIRKLLNICRKSLDCFLLFFNFFFLSRLSNNYEENAKSNLVLDWFYRTASSFSQSQCYQQKKKTILSRVRQIVKNKISDHFSRALYFGKSILPYATIVASSYNSDCLFGSNIKQKTSFFFLLVINPPNGESNLLNGI